MVDRKFTSQERVQCAECGKVNYADDRICGECGRPLNGPIVFTSNEITISCLCGTLGCSGESCNPVTYKLAVASRENRSLRAEIERLRPMAESWESYEAAQARKAELGLTDETETQCAACHRSLQPAWTYCPFCGAQDRKSSPKRYSLDRSVWSEPGGSPVETGKDECQHDLLKPDTTIEVIDPWKAKCNVCITFFDLPGRPVDGWKCVTCGHENPKGALRCQNSKCTVLSYSPENGGTDGV